MAIFPCTYHFLSRWKWVSIEEEWTCFTFLLTNLPWKNSKHRWLQPNFWHASMVLWIGQFLMALFKTYLLWIQWYFTDFKALKQNNFKTEHGSCQWWLGSHNPLSYWQTRFIMAGLESIRKCVLTNGFKYLCMQFLFP